MNVEINRFQCGFAVERIAVSEQWITAEQYQSLNRIRALSENCLVDCRSLDKSRVSRRTERMLCDSEPAIRFNFGQ